MGNGGLRGFYRKCLRDGHFTIPKKETDLVGRFFDKKTVYGDYNGRMLAAGDDGKIDLGQIGKYNLDKKNFSFLQDNADYDRFMERRSAFFDGIAGRQDGEDLESVLADAEADAYVNAYLRMLICCMRILSECEDELEKAEIRRFLDIYLLIDCVKSNQEKAVYVSWIHPAMLLYAQRVLEDENLPKGSGSNFIDELKCGIASMLLARDTPKRMYSSSAIYTIDKNRLAIEAGLLAARQIRSMSTLNSIDSIRILEKVLAAWRQKVQGEPSGKKIELKIAYFGEFSDLDSGEGGGGELLHIQKYLAMDAVRRKYGLEDSCFIFRHFRPSEFGMTDFYQLENGEGYCNLQEMGHLEALFKKYDMVFFLDQGYYYRKAFLEQRESYKSACEFNDYASRMENGENSAYVRQILLHFWTKWGFRYLGDKSGEYEFGRNLYNNIRLRPVPDSCNVYAYVSESRKVGNVDLEMSNVCRGEFYYGHRLIVCHFSNQNSIDISPLINTKSSGRRKIRLNAWRLFKILYDEAYDILYKRWCNWLEIKESVSAVYLLQNVWIEWNYGELVHENNKIDEITLKMWLDRDQIPFIDSKGADAIKLELLGFIKEVFREAFKIERDMVSRYARRAITEAVKSACQELEDFLFADYLQHCYDTCEVSCVLEEGDAGEVKEEISVQTRQAVHAVIKKVDNMHLRIVENNGLYIKQDIIRECCEGVSEEDFGRLLERMNELLALGFRNKGLLAHNINILC